MEKYIAIDEKYRPEPCKDCGCICSPENLQIINNRVTETLRESNEAKRAIIEACVQCRPYGIYPCRCCRGLTRKEDAKTLYMGLRVICKTCHNPKKNYCSKCRENRLGILLNISLEKNLTGMCERDWDIINEHIKDKLTSNEERSGKIKKMVKRLKKAFR